jgi:negative regulator of sigma E activity
MVMGNLQAVPEGQDPGPAGLAPEEVSLLMDGELDEARVEHVCRGLRETTAIETWVCYHVIGDSLRGCTLLAPGFAGRFAGKLAAEPTVLAPSQRHAAPAAMAWAIAASVAAVGVVGWVALTTMPGPPAAVATVLQATAVRAADARPPADNESLLAHQV